MGKRISHITISEAQATQAIQHATLPLDALQPHPRNYRRHPDMQLDRLAASLARFGQVRSIVVQAGAPGRYLVVAGHGVVEAARRLGSVRELRADVIPADWTPEQVEGYLVADNQHAAGADDDLARLAELLQAQADAGYDLATLGSDDDELAALLDSLEGDEVDTDRRDVDDPDGGGDDFDTTPDESWPTRTQPGDLWQLGDHRLLCGDSTRREDVARLMDGETAVLMVTDPPYGVQLDQGWRDRIGLNRLGRAQADHLSGDDRMDWAETYELSGARLAFVWHAGIFSGEVAESLRRAGYEVKQQIVWVKNMAPLSRAYYHWKHEPCWFAVRKGMTVPWYVGRDQVTTWEAASPKHIMSGSDEGKFDHPTQKPLALYVIPLQNHTKLGETIYDPFVGSGTALVAAERLSRRCYAIEIDPRYCDVILRRWEAETGRDASLLARVSVGAQEVAANGE